MTRELLLTALILPLVFAAPSAYSQGQDAWLIGEWVLCEDPDGSPKDALQFNSDGTGLVVRHDKETEFLHRSSGENVEMLANANGYAIPISMTASPGRDKLLLHSDKTGSTSTYIRRDSGLVESCTVKWPPPNDSFKPTPLRGAA